MLRANGAAAVVKGTAGVCEVEVWRDSCTACSSADNGVVWFRCILTICPYMLESTMMMMMTFITQRGESQGKTKKERKATKSKGRGLEEGG